MNEEYARQVKKLAEKILGWLSEGLGLDREALFNQGFGGGEKAVYTMKINYYPPCRPQANLVLGMEPHTDIHGLTLLVPNEIPGLQVFNDNQWFDVEYNPSVINILIGDPIWVCFIYVTLLYSIRLDLTFGNHKYLHKYFLLILIRKIKKNYVNCK